VQHCNVIVPSLYLVLQPLFTAALAAAFLHSVVGGQDVAGMFFIIVGLLVVMHAKMKELKPVRLSIGLRVHGF
jgi:drug/metabolite transporter (DMT)-like permease